MASGALTVQLRPLRLAFLVDPKDEEILKKVFEMNTLLWGGVYNPIIPFYFETPPNWDDGFPKPSNPVEIINGYIDAFDPDFLVKTVPNLPPGVDFSSKRIIELKDILGENFEKEYSLFYGVGMFELWDHLYKTEYSFLKKDHSPKHVPKPDKPEETLFAACSCGNIKWDSEIEKAYRKYFGGGTIRVNAANILGLMGDMEGTPLGLTSWGIKLETQRNAGFRSNELRNLYSFLLLDSTNSQDLVDFWNLRALGWKTISIPITWNENFLIKEIREIIVNQNASYRYNPELKHWTSIFKSRNITEEQFKIFRESLELPAEQKPVALPSSMPSIEAHDRENDNAVPCKVIGNEIKIEIPDSNRPISFTGLSPIFAGRALLETTPRWANAIEFDIYGDEGIVAPILPFKETTLVEGLQYVDPDSIRSGHECTIILEGNSDSSYYWIAPKAEKLFIAWLKKRGYLAQLSSSGVLCKRISELLGSFSGIWAFLDIEILKLLERMAQPSHRDEPTPDASIIKNFNLTEFRAEGKIFSFAELKNRLQKVDLTKKFWWATSELHLKFLIDKKVVQLGANIKCSSCGRSSWFSLDLIDYILTCPKCLSSFSFPSENPPPNPWAFKAAGPFSIENFAEGSYSVLFSVNFFCDQRISHGKASPIVSFELQGQNLPKCECDFALFWQGETWYDRNIYTVFGECKTFNRFNRGDIDKMRSIGRSFPGSIIVFSTLNNELNDAEKELISCFALEGREDWKDDKTLNPVLVLTRNELLSSKGPPYSWKELGEKHKMAAGNYQIGQLLRLCDITQQLYLDMEAYDNWLTKKLGIE